MRFESGNNVLNFINPAQYPATEPIEKVQAVDRSADGSLQVEDFRVAINRRTLVFKNMVKDDYEGLRDWFNNIANGAANQFTFVDELNAYYTVRITSNTFSFSQTYHELYSGSMVLEII